MSFFILDPDERLPPQQKTSSLSNRQRRVAYYKFGMWNKTRNGLVEVAYTLDNNLPAQSMVFFCCFDVIERNDLLQKYLSNNVKNFMESFLKRLLLLFLLVL